MVIRRRLRAVLIPLALYCVSGAAASYFVWHAVNGERGLKAKDAYRQQIQVLNTQLAAVRAEHAHWNMVVAMLKADSVDRDLLDDEARNVLGRVGRDEVVVMTGSPTP